MKLRPFFPYYGSKYLISAHYPAPTHRELIEPFAGSACYSVRHSDRDVLLFEKSGPIAAVWHYLIRTPASEILGLPLLDYGQSVDTLPIPQEARWLIGLWCNPGSAQPKKTLMRWPDRNGKRVPTSVWHSDVRERLARQVDHIRHWRVIHASYEHAPDIEATWFIDPPYQGQGRHYPCGSRGIDYSLLAGWCRHRRGQVMVCENTGADWLPFSHFRDAKANERGRLDKAKSREALWTNAGEG